MPYTAAGKNLMLNALKGTNPATPVTHVGLAQQQTGLAVTGVNSSDVLTATAHGYANGDLVVFTALTGGAGLAVGSPYFVIGVTANTFQVARTVGGAAVDLVSDITVTSTVARLVEVAGGTPAYARQAITYGASVDGAIAFAGTLSFEIPAGVTVAWGLLHSAVSGGTILAISNVTDEAFAGAGQYILSASTLDLNAAG